MDVVFQGVVAEQGTDVEPVQCMDCENADVELVCFFFFSSRRRHTRLQGDWSSDVCSSDLQNHSRRRFPTPATVDEWNLDKSLAFYKDRFADASNFTFVFVGNFDLATMKQIGRASCRERV